MLENILSKVRSVFVVTLVALILLLNGAAIVLRARIHRKLRGH